MSDRDLRDAVKRHNAEGTDGLKDRPRPGRPCKLSEEQRTELGQIVLAGPDVEAEGLAAYTRDGLVKISKDRSQVAYAPTSMGRILKILGLSRQKSRPSHPQKDPAAAEAFKKGFRRSVRNYQ